MISARRAAAQQDSYRPMRATMAAALAAITAAVAIALRRRRRREEDEDDWTSCGGAQLVGNTPLIKLQSLSKLCGCDVYAKCEHLNPNGTGKDRLALAMIKDAEATGSLPKGGGGFIVEGSSGSTTLALAPLVAAAGHKLVAVIPDDCAAEKRDAIRACPGVDVHVVQAAAEAKAAQDQARVESRVEVRVAVGPGDRAAILGGVLVAGRDGRATLVAAGLLVIRGALLVADVVRHRRAGEGLRQRPAHLGAVERQGEPGKRVAEEGGSGVLGRL